MKKLACLILALAFVVLAMAPVVSAAPSIKGKHFSEPQVVFQVTNPPTVVGMAGDMPVVSLGTVAVKEAAETLPKTASAFRG